MTIKRSDDLRVLAWLALAGAAGFLLFLLRPILAPFLFAAILAYICDPLVDRLQRLKLPRTLGVVLVMTGLLGLLAVLLLIMAPLLEKEVALFMGRLPDYAAWLKSRLGPWLHSHFGIDWRIGGAEIKAAWAAHWQSAGGVAARIASSLTQGGAAVVSFLTSVLLAPVVLFYLLRDWDRLLARIDEMIPRRWHAQASGIAREIDGVLAEFLRGQILVMLLMSIYYSLALWLAGLDYALPVGILAGMLVFVPYLGMLTGLTLATLVGFLQFSGFGGLLPVWVAFAIGQGLEGMVITPWLVGDRIGLHPVAVIFALLAFGQLFGFFGVLLALPASAALLVGLRHAHGKYLSSKTYRA